MFQKDKRRALRRWRSRCVWFRRLRVDWNEHGWKRNPRYDYDWSGKEVCRVLSDKTSLCECFDLTNREATRFKDTPNGSSFMRRDNDKYRDKRSSHVPIQEKRITHVEREYFAKPKKYRKPPKFKVYRLACRRCGRHMETVTFPPKVSIYEYRKEKYGTQYWVTCGECRKKETRIA